MQCFFNTAYALLQALETAFSKELRAFDSDQALPAWDALVTRQQSALEAMGVPGMFVSVLRSDKEVRMSC